MIERLFIENVGNETITEEDIADMEATQCMHCISVYVSGARAIFVRLGSGKLLWWHTLHCAKQKRQPRNTVPKEKMPCPRCATLTGKAYREHLMTKHY